jgi:hypothetical protein
MHSHEEDTADIAVYRPAEYDFPPARGRTGFDFMTDGKVIYYGIAPADGVNQIPGRWKAQGTDEITITLDDERMKPMILQVLTCEADKLTLRRS